MVSNGVGLKLVVDDVLVKCSVAFQSAAHSGNIPGVGVLGWIRGNTHMIFQFVVDHIKKASHVLAQFLSKCR